MCVCDETKNKKKTLYVPIPDPLPFVPARYVLPLPRNHPDAHQSFSFVVPIYLSLVKEDYVVFDL